MTRRGRKPLWSVTPDGLRRQIGDLTLVLWHSRTNAVNVLWEVRRAGRALAYGTSSDVEFGNVNAVKAAQRVRATA